MAKPLATLLRGAALIVEANDALGRGLVTTKPTLDTIRIKANPL